MRLRRQWKPSTWLLLSILLTTAVTAKSSPPDEPADALAKFSPDVNDLSDATLAAAAKSPGKAKEIGTKDAPVDGLDGKPHAGPWVGKDVDTTKKSGKISTSASEKIPEAVERLEKEGYGDDNFKGRIPLSNDGVMDDPARPSAEKGTTGTEGGVSEKSKKERAKEERTGKKVSKEPEAPTKEIPSLSEDEQKQIKLGKEDEMSTGEVKEKDSKDKPKPKGAIGLEKTTDLPDSPNSKSKSKSSSSSSAADTDSIRKGAYLVDTMPYTEGTKPPPAPASVKTPSTPASTSLDDTLIQPLHSFVLSLTMILVSEIGDKTFLVAALMAMRHDRAVVFTAAFSALIAMTVLSAVLGHAVPSLLPRRLVSFAAAALFLIFGAKMLREGLAMEKGLGVGEEMREVEAELEEKEAARGGGGAALEAGRGRAGTGGKRMMGVVNLPAPPQSPSSDGGGTSRDPSPAGKGASLSGILAGLNNLFSLVLSPAWVQTFVMTFLGEWGDRSQIATIAMAAGDDYWFVILGALVGHGICTGGAVLGGRALAGRVSLRVVTLGGAAAFIVFGVIYLVETLYSSA